MSFYCVLVLLNYQYQLPLINWTIPYMIAENTWRFKRTIIQRTIMTTSAIALIGRAVVNWIIADKVVSIFIWVLVVRVLVLLSFQSPLPQIIGVLQI